MSYDNANLLVNQTSILSSIHIHLCIGAVFDMVAL